MANKKPMILDIITCPVWGAKQPKQGLQLCGQSKRIIIHHTAGHHPEIENPQNESYSEACRYARDIQHMHMAPGGLGVPQGGNDSGHNFLVCRNGVILQGRWLTVSTIQAGHMVVSAHCPGQNDQIGIEHEHLGDEEMTPAQRISSSKLIAWISQMYGLDHALPLHPHHEFYATSCPANLEADIPQLSKLANHLLSV